MIKTKNFVTLYNTDSIEVIMKQKLLKIKVIIPYNDKHL